MVCICEVFVFHWRMFWVVEHAKEKWSHLSPQQVITSRLPSRTKQSLNNNQTPCTAVVYYRYPAINDKHTDHHTHQHKITKQNVHIVFINSTQHTTNLLTCWYITKYHPHGGFVYCSSSYNRAKQCVVVLLLIFVLFCITLRLWVQILLSHHIALSLSPTIVYTPCQNFAFKLLRCLNIL